MATVVVQEGVRKLHFVKTPSLWAVGEGSKRRVSSVFKPLFQSITKGLGRGETHIKK